MLTDENLLLEQPHPAPYVGGVQRVYRFPGGYGLSLINGPGARCHSFAWEAAVIKGVQDNGRYDSIVYSTPLTDDVAVFDSDDEANAFIREAAAYFASTGPAA